MKIFIESAFTKHNIIRGIKVALLVGSILAIINHYDMLLSGVYNTRRILQVILTFFVPFFVSIYSGGMYERHMRLHHNKRSKK